MIGARMAEQAALDEAAPAVAEPAVAAVPTRPAARQHDGSKWPPGVTPVQHVRPMKVKSQTGQDVYKYVARLRWLPEGVTDKKDSRYDFIPGSFDSPDAAAAALALAQQQLVSAGAAAVWPNGLPTDKKRQKRDAAFWEAERAASVQKAAEKAAARAAREAAEAARPKKPRKEVQGRTVQLPADRDEITVECMRDFLVDPTPAGGENAVPAWAQPPPMPSPAQPAPVPVAPGLAAM